MKKIFVIVLSALVLLLVVAASTTQGLRWLIAGADRIMPGELGVDSVSGSLLGPLDLKGVRYADASVEVQLDSLGLDWRPTALFGARVHIAYLRAAGIDIRMLEAPQQQSPEPVTLKPLPIAVTLEDLSLSAISVLAHGAAEPVLVDRLQLAATGSDSALQVQAFSVDAPLFAARVHGLLSLESQQESTVTTEWWLQLPDMPRLVGTGTLQGNVQRLDVQQDISGPADVVVRGTLQDLLERINWDATVTVSGFNLQLLQPEGPGRVLAADLSGSGELERFTIEGHARVTDPAFGELTADVQLSRAADQWRLQRLELRNPQHPGTLHVNGEFAAGGELFARANWSELAWQLSAQQSLRSASGELLLEGRLDDYRFQGNGLLESTGYPQLVLTAQGSGNRQRIELEQLQGESTRGSFDTSGSVAWQPALEWKLLANVREFDPAFFVPGRDGRLSFRLQTDASRLDEGLQGSLVIDDVAGTLQGQPVSGKTSASFRGNNVTIAEAVFAAGSTRLSASGSLDEDWNMQWDISTQDMGLLLPGAKGVLQGQGSLSGPRDTPRIIAGLDGSRVRTQGFRLDSLRAGVDVDLADRLVSKIDIKGDGIEVNNQSVDSVSLTADGKQSRHVIRFTLQQEKRQLAGNLTASLQAQTWSGTLQELRLEDPVAQNWALQQPAAFSVARSSAAVKSLCMLQADARLCAEADWQPAGWTAALDGDQLPLALLKPWLEQDIALDSSAGLQLRARSDSSGVQGTARLELAAGGITLDDGEETLVLANFGQSHISARLQNNELNGELDLPLQDNGGVSGQLRLGNVVSSAGWFSPQTTIASAFKLNFTDNGLISVFVPDISTSKGQVDGDLAISGTLGNPRLDGTATLKNAEVSVPQLGLQLKDANMQVSGDGNSIALQGSVTSGEGVASFQGQLLLQKGVPSSMDLAVSGTNVQLVNIPQATLFASPDLKLALRQQRLDISGTVRVPEAQIRLRELKGVAKESSDLVVTGQEETAVAAGKYQVYSRVSLVLEDKVSFSGFGLDGNIQGKLDILEEPGKVTRGQGELNIIDGSYKLYGQKLEIEKGRLVFAGGPVENPGLDMRIVRETGDVLAGVRVTGTADSPKLALFSDPAMEQSDMLSYLLLGVPTNRATSAQGAALSGAAASLGLTGGDMLASKLGDAFGIEDVRIESGDTLEESSLVLGKYLSPRLYVSYAAGLFDQSSTFRMRYTLSRRWTVQTETGLVSGADLLYSLEND